MTHRIVHTIHMMQYVASHVGHIKFISRPTWNHSHVKLNDQISPRGPCSSCSGVVGHITPKLWTLWSSTLKPFRMRKILHAQNDPWYIIYSPCVAYNLWRNVVFPETENPKTDKNLWWGLHLKSSWNSWQTSIWYCIYTYFLKKQKAREGLAAVANRNVALTWPN